MTRPGTRQAWLLTSFVLGCLVAPGEARPTPTGGLGDRWLLSPVETVRLPAGWEASLHALAALRGTRRSPTLAPDGGWIAPSGRPAVPWDRLRAGGYRLVPRNVSGRGELLAWLAAGVDGAGGDRPDVLAATLATADPNGDGVPGDVLADDGAPDVARFELRGQGGARGLRPENTLPAFEAAVCAGVGALEVPIQLTRDGVPVPAADATVRPGKHRSIRHRTPPTLPLGAWTDGPALASLTMTELRTAFDRGVTLAGQPAQTVDPAASPVASAFARERGWAGPHAYVTLSEAFGFVRALGTYHSEGPGRLLPEAAVRTRLARGMRWIVELPNGPEALRAGQAALAAARSASLLERLTLQSGDVAVLQALHRDAPAVSLSLVLPR